MEKILARAALVPLKKISHLQGIEHVLGFSATAVSLKEKNPTHLFIVGETLPHCFAASLIHCKAHLFYGFHKSYFLAENPCYPWEQGVGKPYTLALKGGEILHISMQKQNNLHSFFSLYWQDKISTPSKIAVFSKEIRLVNTEEARPTTALLLSKNHCYDLEQTLYIAPPNRFIGTRFAISESKVFIVANTPKSLKGIYGDPFYTASTSVGKLFLPCGKKMEPQFAPHFFYKIAGYNDEEICIWHNDQIEIFCSKALQPFNRREWRAIYGR